MTHSPIHPTESPSWAHFPSAFTVLRGGVFIWHNRVLWKYAAAPLAISAAVLGISYVVLYRLFWRMVIPFRGAEWYWQVLYYVVTVILAVLLLVIVFFLFTRLASTLASPFNDLISERAEALATGWSDQTPLSLVTLLRDAGRSLVHSFKILGVYMVLLFVGLPFLLIPWIGGPLFTVFGALVSSYMHAYEYLGYPMDRRRFSFAEKRSFIRSHMRSAMGFGLGNLAVASIPLLNVLFVPAAVVGGTLLFLELSAFTGGPGTRNKRRPEQIETGLDSPRDGFEQTYPAD